MKIDRKYIMLHPVQGQAAGFARLECTGNSCRASVRLSGLSGTPVRALVLAGRMPECAVQDLGLLQSDGTNRWMLHSGAFPWHGGWHTLAIAADWPQPELIMCGKIRIGICFSPGEAREAVSQYLSLPAPDAPSVPERPSVLRLQPRLCT